MTRIHNNEGKDIAECNLIHYIINPPKCAKTLNSRYYPILHGCMNTRKGKAKFKNFCILLDNECSSMIIMGRLVGNIHQYKCATMQWHLQARNITIDIRVRINLNTPALIVTSVVTWNCHLDESAKGRHDMILGRDILTELGLNLKFSEHVIEGYDVPFNGSTTPMVDMGMHIFKDLNTRGITPEELFTNTYVEEVDK